MRIALGSVVAVAMLAGCVESSVTQVSRNQFIVSTSAAPVCGGTGAQKVAAQMAAIETIRKGFERYQIIGGGSQNNTGVMTTGPTYANTYGTFNSFGNTTYGSGTTYFGGQQTIVYGTHDASFAVMAFNKGDRGYEDAIDAKRTLGPEWQKLVKDGVKSC